VLRAMLLSRPKPPQAGAEGQPLQGYSSQRQLSTKVSGRPLPLPQPLAVGPNRPPRRAKFTHSEFKRANDIDRWLRITRVSRAFTQIRNMPLCWNFPLFSMHLVAWKLWPLYNRPMIGLVSLRTVECQVVALIKLMAIIMRQSTAQYGALGRMHIPAGSN
jgi:hypothetical protein